MKNQTIAATPLKHGEEIRVHVDHFRGRSYLHVRRWYQDDDDRWQPGKGAAVPLELLPWLQDAINQAVAAALTAGDLELEDWTHHELTPPAELLELE